MRYDPDREPDPEEWLALDESERFTAVERYHERAGEELPDLHAMLQATVETQVAMGDETRARATLERLRAEGLDRHDALHAIASVLAELMWEATQGRKPGPDMNAAYAERLEKLTAASWRAQ